MWIFSSVLIWFSFIFPIQHNASAGEEQWNKTTTIKGLPFCAFILRNYLDDDEKSQEVYVLMEPDQVTESNLHLLFKVLSKRFPKPESLTVWVNTDVEQLGLLATGRMVTSSPPRSPAPEGKDQKIIIERQLVYYHRTKEVELFRFNPYYPKANGEKTIILRGKE